MAIDDMIEILNKLPPETREALGVYVGRYLGDAVNNMYESCTLEQKELWDFLRPAHHGDIGYALIEEGEKNRDPLKIGLGKGLMESDKKDKKEWTYAKSRVTKGKKKK
jgi:hypothetical protein